MRAPIFAAALLAAPAAFADPVTYVLDPAHTQVSFRVDRFGFNSVLGQFDQVSGEIVLDEEHPERSTVHAVVQMTSISAGDATRDGHLRGERWFNVAQHPTMEFTSTSVRQIDATHAEVTGNLTLMGQTRPLTLQVTLNRIGPLPNNQRQAAGFSATGALARSGWGMNTALQLIGDNVSIQIEALGVVPAAAPAQ